MSVQTSQEPVDVGCTDIMNPNSYCDNTLDSLSVLPYCLESPPAVGQRWKFPRFNCTFWDAIEATDMIADKSLAVTTRWSKYVQNRTCPLGALSCPKIWTSLPLNADGDFVEKYFTVGVENFTLLVDGNAYGSTSTGSAVSWSLEAAALNTSGKLFVKQSDLGDELCAAAVDKGFKPTASRFGDYPQDKSTASPCYLAPGNALDGSSYDTFVVRDLVRVLPRCRSFSPGFLLACWLSTFFFFFFLVLR